MNQMEFRIDVFPGRASWSYGETREERIEGDEVKLSIDNLTLETARLLERWLNVWDRIATTAGGIRKMLLEPDTFKIVGAHLWILILDNEIGTVLQKKMAIDHDPPLQVLISFDQHTSSDLRSLPWEFLCVPDTETFLAAETKLLLTRYAPQPVIVGTRVDRATDHLGVQFVTALPRLQKHANVADRVRDFQRQLREDPGLDVRDLIEGLDTAAIEAALGDDEHPCHVVHIMGLCRGEPGKPQIWMDSAEGIGWQDPRPLIQALTPANGKLPGLVVLQLCETEEGDADENFERLAPELIRRGIPAVLAMQYTLPTEDQGGVWTKFYKNLAGGMTIGRAVQTSRYGLLHRALNRDFGTPVLYLGEDGVLMQKAAARPAAGSPTTREAPADADSVRKLLKDTLQSKINFFGLDAIRATSKWLASVPLTGTIDDARQQLRAKVRAEEGHEEIVELCGELGAALTRREREREHD